MKNVYVQVLKNPWSLTGDDLYFEYNNKAYSCWTNLAKALGEPLDNTSAWDVCFHYSNETFTSPWKFIQKAWADGYRGLKLWK